ncbi:MAG: hypothetical protein GY754_46365 [bacterium]|nr:hypothetical protein [bacterium]
MTKKLIPEAVQQKFEEFIETISVRETKEALVEFWNSTMMDYFLEMEDCSSRINNGDICPHEAAPAIIAATEKALTLGDKLEELVNNDDIMAQFKGFFRIAGARYALQSKAVKHALDKPGGYPGDYELLEFIYNNVPVSEGFGACADRVFLADDYAKAVRSRKDRMKELLKDYLSSRHPEPVTILNIACGASRDLRELFADAANMNSFPKENSVQFVMIDKDPNALAFSEEQLRDATSHFEFIYKEHSVYDYLKDREKYTAELNGMDLVYSIGLADYIPAQAFQEQAKFFFDILKPGGQLIIAHKDSRNYHPLTPDWWAHWSFHLRDEEEVVGLIKESGIADYTMSIEREEETNIIFFITIKKNKGSEE